MNARPAVVTGHEFVPDPNGKDECLFSPDGSWGATCWWSRADHKQQGEAS